MNVKINTNIIEIYLLLASTGEHAYQHVGVDHVGVLVQVDVGEGLVNLLGGELLPEGHQGGTEDVGVNLSGLLLEGADRLGDQIIIICLAAELAGEHGEEGGEVEGALGLGQHLVELLVGGDTADLVEDGPQVGLVDDAVLVAVDDVEAILELRHLVGEQVKISLPKIFRLFSSK